jgi:GT2 family glycosyltransferase
MPPRLSVVIPTYRRHDALARTLDALEGQTAGFEVIVVDDPEEDAPARVAAAIGVRPFPARHLHREARGVSAARTTGWRAAEAPLVLFLGDDILAGPDLLAEHLGWHDAHAGEPVAVLGHVRWARELPTTALMRWLDRGIQFDYGSIAGADASWAHFYTANISLPRALLERVGGFDEARYPFLYEDLDIGRRLADHGLRVLYNRRAEGEHLHPTDLEQWKRRMAATAPAERRWVQARPEMPAYFHDRFAEAAAAPPAPELAARLARWVPERLPVAGPRVWRGADLWFRQQLAPSFLAAWDQAVEGASSGGSPPGGPK